MRTSIDRLTKNLYWVELRNKIIERVGYKKKNKNKITVCRLSSITKYRNNQRRKEDIDK